MAREQRFAPVEACANNVTDKTASKKALVGAGMDIRCLNDARSFGARAGMDL